MVDKVDDWWPSAPQSPPVIEARIDTSVEAAYRAMLEGRLTRDEYTLVLNKHMERMKDWGTEGENE